MIFPKEDYRIDTLPSGLRVIHVRRPGVAEFFGTATRVGSRDERPEHYGLAHFVEHTIFKGTTARRAGHILNRMEAVGGELNAYTTKEKTVVYSAFPAGNAARAIELIGDLVSHSVFPDRELDKEREVVADEIASYLDTPSEAIFDDFEDKIFAGTGLGHNILGTAETIRNFSSDTCREFMSRYYSTRNMVVFYSGGESADRILRLVEKHFADLPCHEMIHTQADFRDIPHFSDIRRIGLHQAHTIIGARTEGLFGSGSYPMALLTNMLGGPGMNSMLNVELRERRGLVYTVEASTTLYSDTGLFAVYFGCDEADTARCARMVRSRISALADAPLSERQLSARITQYIGQMMMARANHEQAALAMARGMLYHGHVRTMAEIAERIRAVTPDDIVRCAQRIVDSDMLTFT